MTSGDRVGLKRSSAGALRFIINGEDMGVAVGDFPSTGARYLRV